MECRSEAAVPITQEQQHKLEELIYALFPLSYASWKASKASAI